MQNALRPHFWFLTFIFLHLSAWTLAPALIRFNLPMDAMEGALWGHEFQWGYDKNPFLNGWLTEWAIQLSGHADWAIYLLSQLSVVLCFWAVFRFAKKIVSPLYALISVLLLEGIQYYNLHAIDFSDNTLELAMWSLTTLCCYNALTKDTWRAWILTGFFAGCALMTKYYSALLLLPLAVLILKEKKFFKNPRAYVALSLFCLIITPHIIWLFQHDFITVHYMLSRTDAKPRWFNHVYFPLKFTLEQFEALLPALLLLLILVTGKKPFLNPTRIQLSPLQYSFLWYVSLGPFLLTLLISLISGITLRAGWGVPLFSFWGLLFLITLQPAITTAKFYRFLIAVFILLGLTVWGYCHALIQSKDISSANFPGKQIAKTITERWHTLYHTPLRYVAGTRWIAGNIAYYSKDAPSVFLNWDKKLSPWIDENRLREKGGVFVWEMAAKEKITYADIKAKFPFIPAFEIMQFTLLRNKNLPPVVLEVAVVAPN